MKPLKVGSGGYTIVEVMIFLAISMVMFASVVGVMGSQNRRNQFTESVNTFNQRLGDILNDVDTGYFPSNGDFSCAVDASGNISFAPVASGNIDNNLGKNQDCVFAGKSITVDAANRDNFIVQTLVGRRTLTDASGATRDVENVTEAKLTQLTQGSAASADNGTLSADVQIVSIRSFNDDNYNIATDADGLGIITGFGKAAGTTSSGLKSGAIKSELAVWRGGAWQAAPHGVIICLAEGGATGNGRVATIRIGAGSSQDNSVVTIDDDAGCA